MYEKIKVEIIELEVKQKILTKNREFRQEKNVIRNEIGE